MVNSCKMFVTCCCIAVASMMIEGFLESVIFLFFLNKCNTILYVKAAPSSYVNYMRPFSSNGLVGGLPETDL